MRASVCMATYNGERYIEAQVASILPQLGADDELVVSDDGSSDGTVALIARFADARIRLLEGRGAGVARNFENALRGAAGRYLFLADQDDVWLEGKLETMCGALERHALVVSDCRVIDAQGATLHESYFRLLGSRRGLLRNFIRNRYLGCCMALRRELLELALPIPPGVAHDYWIGMLAEFVAEPLFLERPLLLFRRHAATASFAAGVSGRPLAVRLLERLRLAARLAARLARRR